MATPLSVPFSKVLDQILLPYQKRVEEWLKHDIAHLCPSSVLQEASAYTLLNGGKRFRPALVAMIGDALGNNFDVSRAALAVEYFHTASLVADDLPCMDDDDERRHKPSLHKVYGEATALLVSYGLIAAGYERLAQNAALLCADNPALQAISDRICTIALENATRNTGFFGATGGQYLDINPPDTGLETIRHIIQQKTAALFEVSFVFGWLFGGGDIASLPQVKIAAGHFGMAFQLADDLQDQEVDAKNPQSINLAVVMGSKVAFQSFQEEMDGFFAALKQLNLQDSPLMAIGLLLQEQTHRGL